jgi:23S rRNA (guanosine2251-2'-O)-methyltransferase
MYNEHRTRPADNSTDLIFGIRPIQEALASAKSLEKILVRKGAQNQIIQEIIDMARRARVPIQVVPEEKLNRLTRKNHQGVIGFLSPIEFHSLSAVITDLFERGESPFLVVLDGVTDVRNFGAIVRSVECLGAHSVIVPIKGAARMGDDAMKTSAGALFKVPVCREPKLDNTITYLKQSGLHIVACTEKGTQSAYDMKLEGPVALVMGSEDEGISPEVLAQCDQMVYIPMIGEIGSLNVSVATGIMLSEIARRRTTNE